MANSNDLPVDNTGPAGRTGVDKPGSKDSMMPDATNDVSPASPHSARRMPDFGGSSASCMQAAIGGPFGSRTGNAATKTARVNGLPA